MSSETNSLTAFSDSLEQAVSKASESTVLVNGRRRMPASGIAYAPDLILTADHVVERDEDISVFLPDGGEITAKVAGRDPGSDLVVLRLDKSIASPAEKAAQEARVGQLVLAIGRPSPDGIEASFGIVSAVGGPIRTGRGGLLERYLRTDTIPFPGFSGGPLVDTAGRVLGLNTSGLAHGAAITLPASLAWSVADTLDKHGHVQRGYLGIRSQPVSISSYLRKALGREQEMGLLLVSVEAGSPAEAGGLMVGDILVAVGDQPINDPEELFISLTGQVVGKSTPIQVLRGGQPTTLNVTVGERK
jgi:serine protease DegQ